MKDVNLEEDRESAEDQNIDNQYEDLQQKYKKLQMEKIMMEESYKSEISDLQAQVGFISNQHVILYIIKTGMGFFWSVYLTYSSIVL